MKKVLWCMLAVLSCVVPAEAQFFDAFNPKVRVTISHAPGFGIKLSRVAFGLPTGRCSDQVLDNLTQLFVDNDVEVIDRQHLDSILAEHRFSLSGYVDKETAARLGQILGPTTLLFIKVTRCHAEQKALYEDVKDYKGNTSRKYISRTDAWLKGSLQAVDLATGRILKARTFDERKRRSNEAIGDRPEYPADEDVLDDALRSVTTQTQRLFFPWTDVRELYYYDDKDCNMKAAFNRLKGGDHAGALEVSLQNIEACKANPKAKPKHVGRTYYNAGMSYFILGDYDNGLKMFDEAQKLYAYEIVTNAIAECRRAKDEANEMQQYEERVALEPTQAQQPVAGAAQPAVATAKGGEGTAEGKPAASSVEQRLQKLDELLKKGLITRQDYDKKKAEILKEL